jgi:hypothetical protein
MLLFNFIGANANAMLIVNLTSYGGRLPSGGLLQKSQALMIKIQTGF